MTVRWGDDRYAPSPTPEVVIAQALCPGSQEHWGNSWRCPLCMDAARRVAAHWPEVQAAMALFERPA